MQKVKEISHKKLKFKSGIYKLIINNHIYIGSSKNLYYRLKEHLSKLRNSIHRNSYLQNCFNKHKEDMFYYEIIEFCNENILIEREKYFIDLLKPDLNVVKNPVNISISNESKIKISDSLKKYYTTNKVVNRKWDKIKIFTKEGVFIEELTKLEIFEKGYVSNENQFAVIISVCKNRKKSYNSYIFKFDYDNTIPIKLGTRNLSKKYCYETIDLEGNVIQLSSNYEIMKFLSKQPLKENNSFTFTLLKK